MLGMRIGPGAATEAPLPAAAAEGWGNGAERAWCTIAGNAKSRTDNGEPKAWYGWKIAGGGRDVRETRIEGEWCA